MESRAEEFRDHLGVDGVAFVGSIELDGGEVAGFFD